MTDALSQTAAKTLGSTNPEVLPLLAELETAIESKSEGQIGGLLRAIAELFGARAEAYSQDQVSMFDTIVQHLARQIEVAVRAELSARLAPLPVALPETIRSFSRDDDIAVAGPMLTHCRHLDDADLADVALRFGQPHLLAVAHRSSLSEIVTDILVVRGDQGVLRTMATNQGAHFSEQGFSRMVARAQSDDALTEAVGVRRDLPRHLFLRLLAKASTIVRERLADVSDVHADVVRATVAGVSRRISIAAAAESDAFLDAERRVAALRAQGRLDGAALIDFARQQRFEAAAMTLAELTGVALEFAERAILQVRPEALIILAKAADLEWACVKALLLMPCRGHGLSMHDLDRCLTHFHRLKRDTALQIMRAPRFTTQAAH